MSSPLPVPSKAALTALRGLVLGTSCTLALVAEDRRRRINNALAFVQNGERIKSFKGYRKDGAALALAIEEEALFDAGLLSFSPPLPESSPLSHQLPRRRPNRPESPPQAQFREQLGQSIDAPSPRRHVSETSAQYDATAGNLQADQQLRPKPAPKTSDLFLRPTIAEPHISKKVTSRGSSWPTIDPKIVQANAPLTVAEILAITHEACQTRDPQKLDVARKHVLKVLKGNAKRVASPPKALMEASALLTRTYQELGQVEDAAGVLAKVVGCGPIEETDYFHHEPLSLLESLMARGDQMPLGPGDLDILFAIFLPRLIVMSRYHSPDIFRIGRRLLRLAFEADHIQPVMALYRRCSIYMTSNSYEFVEWVITRLQEKGECRTATRLFLSAYSKMTPDAESITRIGYILVRSVEGDNNFKADRVLEALLDMTFSVCDLRTEWVVRLMLSHRANHLNDFGEVEPLFKSLEAAGVRERVRKPAAIYRVMIDMAMEAGQPMKAQAIMEEAVTEMPCIASDVRIQGIFALQNARLGNWEEVRKAFEAMNLDDMPAQHSCGRVFVSILKVYGKEHTVYETEAFLKSYVDELGVPLTNYVVTLMANHYGSIRDSDAFIQWMKYCTNAGFKVDASFTNAILTNFRRQWKLPFHALRTTFRKLRALNPDYVDHMTEMIIADAAVMDKNLDSRTARNRLFSLKIKPNKRPRQGKCATVDEVTRAMREALVCDGPDRALRIYRNALEWGMVPSKYTLRVAVQAHLRSEKGSHRGAFRLLEHAQERGGDIGENVNLIIIAQVRDLAAIDGKEAPIEAVEKLFEEYEKEGTSIPLRSFDEAAKICLMAGSYQAAVSYALKASEAVSGRPDPCCNFFNFTVFLRAYADLVQASGLRQAIANALTRSYVAKPCFLKALKNVRIRVKSSMVSRPTDADRQLALEVIEDGIREAVEVRRRLRMQAEDLEMQAVDIMRDAALKAGCAPVNFDDVPCLAEKRRCRKGKTRETKNKEPADAFHQLFEAASHEENKGQPRVAEIFV
ncbi:hypothetical protein B0H63DRAFT_465822 [Podospora didyma]|uniref:Pentatricopeptide repeat-containing protein n=1 Tax=Podospora didyma TaxID=330526 RepID=A0AAE0NZF5_9PEZI|nr:hypothetical protein B0H63DRAFT_465822 [Podospora didyma]